MSLCVYWYANTAATDSTYAAAAVADTGRTGIMLFRVVIIIKPNPFFLPRHSTCTRIRVFFFHVHTFTRRRKYTINTYIYIQHVHRYCNHGVYFTFYGINNILHGRFRHCVNARRNCRHCCCINRRRCRGNRSKKNIYTVMISFVYLYIYLYIYI